VTNLGEFSWKMAWQNKQFGFFVKMVRPGKTIANFYKQFKDDLTLKNTKIKTTFTDKNGRITYILNSEKSNICIYKLIYFTNDYFKKNNVESFYPFIEVVFQIKDEKHYHVPITLSAFGYATYRGN
jgi:hydroxyisourate hydrolase